MHLSFIAVTPEVLKQDGLPSGFRYSRNGMKLYYNIDLFANETPYSRQKSAEKFRPNNHDFL